MDLKKIYEDLKADFPKEAYSIDSSRGFDLTSLKAQYIIERLNDVLGISGWSLVGCFEETEKGILYIGTLSILKDKEEIHSVEAVGYSDKKKNIGDTYKSARTDALSKSSSSLGLGNDMFKGKIKVAKQSGGFKKEPAKKPAPANDGTKPNFRRKKVEEKQDGGI